MAEVRRGAPTAKGVNQLMYKPSYRTKNNGVPILKKKEISSIGEKFVQDFQPDALRNPVPIDIDALSSFTGVYPCKGARHLALRLFFVQP